MILYNMDLLIGIGVALSAIVIILIKIVEEIKENIDNLTEIEEEPNHEHD